jgi:SAM-dependent methyltransferase
MPISSRIRKVLPEAAVPAARHAYYEARSSVVLTEIARQRLLRATVSPGARAILSGVSPRVSANDSMGGEGWGHYFATGLDAIRCIDAVLKQQPIDPKRILDLPSGWGRVLRFLAVRFPDAALVASDIVYDGPLFCAKRFGAQPVASSGDFASLTLPDPFDLIWVGSLFSHLDNEHADSLLRLAARTLSPHGILVATTLGDSAVDRFEAEGPGDQHTPEEAATAIADYRRSGFGFVDYRWVQRPDSDAVKALASGRYGVAFVSRDWIGAAAGRAGLEPIFFRAQDWDNNQDVHGFRLRDSS